LELDLWDGDNGEPMIYHGRTITSKIKAVDVIKALREYGFAASPYPLILSLEVHCSPPQQDRFSEYFTSILQDMLVTREEINRYSNKLPSPHEFRGRVFLKAGNIDLLGSAKVTPTFAKIISLPTAPFEQFSSFPSEAWQLASFGETKTVKLTQSDPQGLIAFTEKHLTRTYPNGKRVDSSNYSPMQAWAAGLHLCSLNFQTSSEPMWFNHGLFRDNGACGYVLKPSDFASGMKPTTRGRFSQLWIRVISGRNLSNGNGEGLL
jgi:phosphatidylinositol phospholipase C delta